MKTVYTHANGTKAAIDCEGNVFFDAGLGWRNFNYRGTELLDAINAGTYVYNQAETQAEMCRQHGTKQCAAICLSHSCLIPLGECPSIADVWTPGAIKKFNRER